LAFAFCSLLFLFLLFLLLLLLFCETNKIMLACLVARLQLVG
jgi:hypothetical protein